MRSDYLKYLISLFTLLMVNWTISCSGRAGKETAGSSKNAPVTDEEPPVTLVKITAPGENAEFRLGDPIKVSLAPENKSRVPDSVLVYFDGKLVTSLRSEMWECDVTRDFTSTTGRKSLKVTAYKGGRARTTITRFVIVYSDLVPKRYGFKISGSYPHDRDAFTQGLFYDNGLLYEGTGQEAGSSLREVELETGRVRRQLNLGPSFFGEGITLYKNRIYQVTWTNKVGFVYDKSTFGQINKIYYHTEGWGLTTMEDRIVMSDGTNVLYIYEPEMFTVVSRIEVYDNERKVDQLNELEYINGEIWANIWMTDLIARIDPETGRVLAYIDLKGILNDPGTDTSVKVLNGIAYDPSGNRIFVTGKNWPKLFEIRLTE
jgi:glutamine cyclotransferase